MIIYLVMQENQLQNYHKQEEYSQGEGGYKCNTRNQ